MSQGNREEEEPDEDFSNSSDSSTSTSCITATTNTSSTSKCSNSDSKDTSSSSSDNEGNNDNLQLHRHRQCPLSQGHGSDTTDRNERNVPHYSEDVGERLQSTTGHKCDTRATSSDCQCATTSDVSAENYDREQTNASYPKEETKSQPLLNAPPQYYTIKQSSSTETNRAQSYSRANLDKSASERLLSEDDRLSKHDQHFQGRNSLGTTATSLGSSYSNLSSKNSTIGNALSTVESQSRRTLRPAPSPSPSLSVIDTNNNKGNNSSLREGLSNLKRTNFSKSASGSRLINRSRPSVCDCLSQDCGEKKHSNRRQFIEQYYNSRTQLPSANTSTSSFNISTPLNRLSECDAITRRLLSSPIRATNIVESPTQRTHVSEIDRSRRASLGTNALTDQVFLFASSTFDSNLKKNKDNGVNNQLKTKHPSTNATAGLDNKLKQQPQQQTNITGRSLSVCDEETLNPRIKSTSANHSSNLNRAISLAYESGSSSAARRLLTIIPLFGCDIKTLEQFTRLGLVLPPVIDSAVDYLLVNGIDSIGIFRKSGVKSRILSLRQRIEANQNLKFAELNQNNEFSIYDIADLVKMWFRDLKPVPLMTKELIKLISSYLNRTSSSSNVTAISARQDGFASTSRSMRTVEKVDPILRDKVNSITTLTHRTVLLRALSFLAKISSRCEKNQMTSQNLAICLTPSLCETESDQNSILHDQKALEYCIDNCQLIFGDQVGRQK